MPAPRREDKTRCRSCGAGSLIEVLDLGNHPPAGGFPAAGEPDESAAPLHAMVCGSCWLLQLVGPVPSEPLAPRLQATASTTMSAHADAFVDEVLSRVGREGDIVEIASHGGHLQPRFASRGMRTLIVDPSDELVADAEGAGGAALAAPIGAAVPVSGRREGGLVVDNYLLAHLPDPNAEMEMIRSVIGEAGSAVIEFDHALPDPGGRPVRRPAPRALLVWISDCRCQLLLERHGLYAVDATLQPVYGGAVRIWVALAKPPSRSGPSVQRLLDDEESAGIRTQELYVAFARRAEATHRALRSFLEDARAAGRRVAGYGAPSRGNTLLNAAGVTPDLLPYTADASPGKQGRRMAGSGVPIVGPDRLLADQPDDVLVLTWDIVDEVVAQLPQVHDWGGRFVVPIPSVSYR